MRTISSLSRLLRSVAAHRRATPCLGGDASGQATVEYLVAGTVIVIVAMGMAALWHLAQDGTLVQHASLSASHAIGEMTGGALGDVLVF